MKRFLVKLGLFCLPMSIIALPLLILLGYTGYLFSFSQIARMQTRNPILYGVSADESGYYKEAVIAERQPSVLLSGSSRVLSFRAEFCQPQTETFYNGGLRTLDNETLLYFGQGYIDAHAPDILLIGLDQPYFTANYQRPYISLIDETFTQRNYILSQVKGFALHTRRMSGKDWTQIFDRSDPISGNYAIGTFAILNGVGHRSDGSFQYGQGEVNANIIGSISTPDILFQPASELNEVALAQLDSLLAYATDHDVQVIGFFPPFAPDVWDNYFAENPDDYSYLPLLISTVESMFSDYDFSVYDYTNPHDLAITDEIMMDGWHMSERASLMLFLELLAQDSDLSEACPETDYLENLLEQSEHPFIVIPD